MLTTMQKVEFNRTPRGTPVDPLVDSKAQKALVEERMAEYARKREMRLQEQANQKKKLFEEMMSPPKTQLEILREKWEQEEAKRAHMLAMKQLQEIEEIKTRKKKHQVFEQYVKERAAKAHGEIEAFHAQEAARLAKLELEKQQRKEKKAEEQRKKEAYAKRVQQRRLSATAAH